jgi:hypothetical protein
MTFTINNLTRCPGGNHYELTLTFEGGPTVTLETTKQEMDHDPAADRNEARREIIDRVRSEIKERAVTTFAQIQTLLIGQTFKV